MKNRSICRRCHRLRLVNEVRYCEDCTRVLREQEKPHQRRCPHCSANGIRATLQATLTERGDVQRCWQCGGEYLDGAQVWPAPPGILQPRSVALDNEGDEREPM